METAIGVFDSRDKAEHALRELLKRNVPKETIVFLTRSETEAQSLAKEFGAWAGGFAGGAAGMTAGVVAATLFVIPGLGQALALGIGATALLGLAGAGAGSAAGKKVAESPDVPESIADNEDAALFRSLLRDGRSLIIVRTEWHEVASVACGILDRTGIGIKDRTNLRMQSTTRPSGDVQIVEISGRITLGEGNVMLRDIVQSLLDGGNKKIILLLANVDHIDSAGIGELVRSHTTVRKAGGHLKLAAPNSKVQEMFKMTSLHSVFDVYPDEAAAIRSFAQSSGATA
ncbi:MAG TPA: STAS domain-containing protein [Candidatus Acidoferrales bacterium]|nr:STAS domain-containing protein [Candidatus Acidoferrales bacterium]